MRDIKFRAWNKGEKRMYFNVQDAYDMLHCHNVEYSDERNCGCSALDHVFSPSSFGEVLGDKDYEVMQYTGLKDSKGKEIYEGDIVKTFYFYDPGFPPREEVSSVFFDSGIFCRRTKSGNLQSFVQQVDDMKILGNIYENPELLKGELVGARLD